MSIILKGIDLPKNAKVQIIVESPTESFRKQIPKSKVIQIPKGHGRLIDGDRLIRDEIDHLLYHLPNGDTAIPKIDVIHAPTILEAEE